MIIFKTLSAFIFRFVLQENEALRERRLMPRKEYRMGTPLTTAQRNTEYRHIRKLITDKLRDIKNLRNAQAREKKQADKKQKKETAAEQKRLEQVERDRLAQDKRERDERETQEVDDRVEQAEEEEEERREGNQGRPYRGLLTQGQRDAEQQETERRRRARRRRIAAQKALTDTVFDNLMGDMDVPGANTTQEERITAILSNQQVMVRLYNNVMADNRAKHAVSFNMICFIYIINTNALHD